ncbi:XdhC family protein [Streptomyces sp. TP-A0874]|uniref:XdhC family protein n=1 Tax=Streptomyces sp. TP-A0874 TaxID=549819 RepID=UPI0008530CA7|nr:XdhC/CoxI family protein [Streptomyces sp. TP-A0874]
MLDIAEQLHRWCEEGRDFAVATVVSTSGSAPRQPGAALAVDMDGTAVGSVSGGCVEGAVYELCQEVLETGEILSRRFGYSDDDAFATGLTCGGTVEVAIVPVRVGDPGRPVLAAALAAAARAEAVALAQVVEGPPELLGRALCVRADGTHSGSLAGTAGGGSAAAGGGPLDRTAAAEARALLQAGSTGTVVIGAEGSRCGVPLALFVESSTPPPRMIIFGAIDFAAALAEAGRFLGHHVTVCDARPVFATPERFPSADEVVVDWPHRYLDAQRLDGRAVLCVLTHDAKFDVPLLQRALRLPVAYVGAMGSRRTHLDRLDRLRAVGLTEAELGRLRSPIGLDLGARTPQETALSIAAEIVACRRGGSGVPLTGGHTPIHRPAPVLSGSPAG